MEVKQKHIGVYGVMIQEEKIALIRKARGGYTGKLDLPGGGMEHGELPAETLKREILEEAGVVIDDFSLLDVTSATIKWQIKTDLWEDLHHIGILYQVVVSEMNLKTDADGLDSLGADWYQIDSLSKEELSPFTIYSLEKLGYKLK